MPRPIKMTWDRKLALWGLGVAVVGVPLGVIGQPLFDRWLSKGDPATPPAVYVVPPEAIEGSRSSNPVTPSDELPRPTGGVIPMKKAPSGTIDKENGSDDWLQERNDRRQIADQQVRTPGSLLGGRGDLFVVPDGDGKRLILVSDERPTSTPQDGNTLVSAAFTNPSDKAVSFQKSSALMPVEEGWMNCRIVRLIAGDGDVDAVTVPAHATSKVDFTLRCFAGSKRSGFPKEAVGRMVLVASAAE